MGQADPLEEGTAAHSSIVAWRIHELRSLAGLQFKSSQRVRHNTSDLAAANKILKEREKVGGLTLLY